MDGWIGCLGRLDATVASKQRPRSIAGGFAAKGDRARPLLGDLLALQGLVPRVGGLLRAAQAEIVRRWTCLCSSACLGNEEGLSCDRIPRGEVGEARGGAQRLNQLLIVVVATGELVLGDLPPVDGDLGLGRDGAAARAITLGTSGACTGGINGIR